MIKERIASDANFASIYPSVDYVLENVYLGHLPEIVQIANIIKEKTIKDFKGWKSLETSEVFQLIFLDSTDKTKKKLKAKFVDGEATVKIALS